MTVERRDSRNIRRALRTLVSDSDPQVRQLAQIDDPSDRNSRIGGDFDISTDDPSYRFTADQDATYRIQLWNQFGGTTDDGRDVYRLVIRPPQPR